MAQQLEPEQVEIRDIPEWLRQSHGLICRRWLIFAGLSVLYVIVSLLTRNMGYLTLPLGYIITLCFLASFILAARAADESIALSLPAMTAMLQKIVARLIILALLVSLLTLVALVIGNGLLRLLPELLPGSLPGAAIAVPPILTQLGQWVAPAVMRFFVVFLFVVIAGMWFLLPLLVFHTLSLLETALLSKKAERINISVILVVAYTPLLALILLLLLHDISYLLTTLLIPYFGALQYVSYRHVFTQKKHNSPARALAPALHSLTA